MIYNTTNAYYFSHINSIGGIESHLYYVARKYEDKDITVFYKTGDNKQLQRLRQFVRCIQITPQDRVECTNLFCCFNREILNQCEAKNKYLVLHGDYKDMLERKQLSKANLPIDKRIDQYLGVSKLVCDSWKKATGIEAINVYEPVFLEDIQKPLVFCSATRLTREKGWERMKKLAKEMNKEGINYMWFVFTDSPKEPETNMYFLPTRLDITDKLGAFDAFVQLSDNEGYCLSVIEALTRKVPVIATKLPVFEELGINQDNAILLNHDMSNIPMDEIRKIRSKKFTYKEPEDRWAEFLAPGIKTYTRKQIKIRATGEFKKHRIRDTELKHIPEEGEEWYVDENRLAILEDFQNEKNLKLFEKLTG